MKSCYGSYALNMQTTLVKFCHWAVVKCITFCRYVVGVGWDRCINIYTDEPNDTGLHQLVDPQDRWEDDKVW